MSKFQERVNTEKAARAVKKPTPGEKRGPGRPPKDPNAVTTDAPGIKQPATEQAQQQTPAAKIPMAPIIANVVRAPFRAWAESQGVPELDLSMDSARQIAEDIEKLMNHYFPDKIPPIYLVWTSLATNAGGAVMTRVEIVKKKRKELAAKGGGESAAAANGATVLP